MIGPDPAHLRKKVENSETISVKVEEDTTKGIFPQLDIGFLTTTDSEQNHAREVVSYFARESSRETITPDFREPIYASFGGI